MKSVSIKVARDNFAEILENALGGTTTVITRRGKEVAVIAPMPAKANHSLPSLKEFRKKIRLKGKPLSQTVIQNRRESRY